MWFEVMKANIDRGERIDNYNESPRITEPAHRGFYLLLESIVAFNDVKGNPTYNIDTKDIEGEITMDIEGDTYMITLTAPQDDSRGRGYQVHRQSDNKRLIFDSTAPHLVIGDQAAGIVYMFHSPGFIKTLDSHWE